MKYPRAIKETPTTENSEHDFSEYMWMAEEGVENFDRQVEHELLEEMFIEACFEEMLAEEEQWFYPEQNSDLTNMLENVHLTEEVTEEKIKNSRLNPNAPEFVPRWSKSTSVTN